MMWQDFVFLIGSMTSVIFLYPTLRDSASQVPRATSVPSMLIGGAYAMTFYTLGMSFSAFGAFAACTMWSLIALFRNPDSSAGGSSRLTLLSNVWRRLSERTDLNRPTTATSEGAARSTPFESNLEQTSGADGQETCDD